MKTKIGLLIFVCIVVNCKAQDTHPRVKITDFPKKDLSPPDFKRKDLKGEWSENYYYGIGVPIDYVKARYLAFKEMGDSVCESSLDGADILLMIYANGYGVKRDFDICMRLTYGNVWAAPAEIEGRIQYLKDMQEGDSTEVFDICDDITSGLMEGICESITFEKNSYHRDSIINFIMRGWPKKDKTAYTLLRKTASDFFEYSSEYETDLSGTARVMFEYMAQDSLEGIFLDEIIKADKCTFPNYSNSDFINADSKLNSVYSKIINKTDSINAIIFVEGTVTKEHIKFAERKWIKYRDAWVAFGKIRCPLAPDYALKTLITKDRIFQLLGE